MDNYIKAVEDRLALARRCLPLVNGNAALKLQLEGKILKFEQLRNQFSHARSAAVPQLSTVAPVPPPSQRVAAALSTTATATTGTASLSTSIFAATIQAPQKYPQYILV